MKSNLLLTSSRCIGKQAILFTLVVNNFGVKCVSKQHVDHPVQAITKDYESSKDWTGGLYCGIMLEWDYDARTLDFSMTGYIHNVLQKYKHEKPTQLHNAPYPCASRKYNIALQEPMPHDYPPCDKCRHKLNPTSSGQRRLLCPHCQVTALATQSPASKSISQRKELKIQSNCWIVQQQIRIKNEILCIRYDTEYSFRCILPFCGRRQEPSVWKFLHG